MINSAEIKSTQYNPLCERWEVKFQSPAGLHTAVSKQLVLATGIGSQKPNIPDIGVRNLYQGISVHSAQYKNGQELKEKGANVSVSTGFIPSSRKTCC
jgi:cation diffusion facilitator CzcD-associated flavoprotein CzcO